MERDPYYGLPVMRDVEGNNPRVLLPGTPALNALDTSLPDDLDYEVQGSLFVYRLPEFEGIYILQFQGVWTREDYLKLV